MALRPAVDEDYHALFGEPAPGHWIGWTEQGRWLIEGMGCLYVGTDGRWWLGLKRVFGTTKTKTTHTGALRLMQWADEQGIVVHAMCDPDFRGTDKWLLRLGFEPSDEDIGGITVWTRRP